MKYAFMSFSCPQLALGEMLALAAEIGYDGIEPRLASGHRHGIETGLDAAQRQAVRRQIDDSGITLACLATGCTFANPAKTRAGIDEAYRAIDLAGDLGCSRLRLFGGVLPPEVSRERAIGVLAEAMTSLAPQARQRGVVLCLETHDDWSHPQYLAEVMRRVDNPAVAVNWDIMHPVRQGGLDMDQAFNLLAPWIRHVHFHDGVTRRGELVLVPAGEGDIDHRRAVQLLQAARYDGFLSGEWINWEPCEVHLPRELATMKRYEREAGAARA